MYQQVPASDGSAEGGGTRPRWLGNAPRTRTRKRGSTPRPQVDAGTTIVEIVAAVTVFALTVTASTQMLVSGLGAMQSSQGDVVAGNLATQMLEKIIGQPFSTTASQVSAPIVTTQTSGGVSYTLTQTTQWVTQGSTTSDCSVGSGPGSEQLLQVQVAVRWPQMKGSTPVTAATTLTPPVGAYQTSSGNISVGVLNAAANPAAGVTVTITNLSTKQQMSIVTPSDGCAFFAFIATGSYKVSLQASGYVDSQEVSSPTKTTSVTSGQTSVVGFNEYDQASTIVASFPATAPLPAGNIPLALDNTGLDVRPYDVSPTPALTGGTETVAPLFPYTSGYDIWSGSCAYNDPGGVTSSSNPIYPGAPPPPLVTMTPGQSSSVTVPMQPIAVKVSHNGSPVSGASITAVEDDPSPCASPSYTLTATDSNGSSLTELPYGQYMVTAMAGSLTSATAYVWVTPSGLLAESGQVSGAQAGTAEPSVSLTL